MTPGRARIALDALPKSFSSPEVLANGSDQGSLVELITMHELGPHDLPLIDSKRWPRFEQQFEEVCVIAFVLVIESDHLHEREPIGFDLDRYLLGELTPGGLKWRFPASDPAAGNRFARLVGVANQQQLFAQPYGDVCAMVLRPADEPPDP